MRPGLTRRLLVASALALAGCATTVPPPERLHDLPQCHVWSGDLVAQVTGGVAKIYGADDEKGGAFYAAPNVIAISGLERPAGLYQAPWIVIHTPLGDMTGSTQLQHVRAGNFDVYYNPRCSDRDAALGVTRLVVAIATAIWLQQQQLHMVPR